MTVTTDKPNRRRRPPPQEPDFFRWIGAAENDEDRAWRIAMTMLNEFETFYFAMRTIPQQAKAAFEDANWAEALYLSHKRLGSYSRTVQQVAVRLNATLPDLTEQNDLWARVVQLFEVQVEQRYERDLAIAFLNSVHRLVYSDTRWKWVDYNYRTPARTTNWLNRASHIVQRFDGADMVSPGTVAEIVSIPALTAEFRSLDADCAACADHINKVFGFADGGMGYQDIAILNAGFYRNRGAYVVGQIVTHDGTGHPLLIAMEHGQTGIFIDAVITSEADAHNLFSSTLANFHVTNTRYHELCAFLSRLMPGRPLGLHYSTIGYNHIGKVAVMDELSRELSVDPHRLATAPGFKGSVAMGFSAEQSRYVLKVIRDEPAEHYKWDVWPGTSAVLEKYRRVHEINRTGSMLDNIIYQRVAMDRSWFDDALLEELTDIAASSIRIEEDRVAFSHLIVQPKLVPIPLYLETATRAQAEDAIIELGDCIKNNAAANIFNRDLDARNYGVNQYGRVYLFDYDAVEPLVDIKVRTNSDREEGEEDIPSWFFEDGIIFLPEEMLPGLRIEDRELRRVFTDRHGDLLGTGYWTGMQAALKRDWVPKLKVYPRACKID